MGTIVGLDANYKASTNMEAAKCIIISNKRNPTVWGKKKGVEVSYFDMISNWLSSYVYILYNYWFVYMYLLYL